MKPSTLIAINIAVLIAAGPAAAQGHSHSHSGMQPEGASSESASATYAGLQQRGLKALSEREIVDLRAGRGMGLALAAELNGYPGPSHVLEHAQALRLTEDQTARTKSLFDAMKQESIDIGERIVAEEAALNRLFAERHISRALLEAATAKIGALQGSLRSTHLRYHIIMVGLLTPEQTARYAELRGYTGTGAHEQH